MGIETLYDAKQVQPNSIFNLLGFVLLKLFSEYNPFV